MIDADISYEVNEILAKRLFDGPATGFKKELQIAMIQKKNQAVLEYLASEILTRPYAAEKKNIIRLVIENGGSVALDYVDKCLMTEAFATGFHDLRKLIRVRKAGSSLQRNSCERLF
ncbi:MAG: hypothetical protein H7326_06980 [Bdellovibrionaceae bacterium]|nr:hypothetical protein [Pseudobdellovibrionaceae bacterium]